MFAKRCLPIMQCLLIMLFINCFAVHLMNADMQKVSAVNFVTNKPYIVSQSESCLHDHPSVVKKDSDSRNMEDTVLEEPTVSVVSCQLNQVLDLQDYLWKWGFKCFSQFSR